MNELQNRIYGWLKDHEAEMTEDICSLVRIPSVEGEASEAYPFGEACFRAMEKALEIADRCGLKTELNGRVVGRAALRPGKVDFGIWAHTDVVPADGVWDTDPFVPVLKDGRIYGRGATDNKGQLTAVLYALRALKELGIPVKHNVAVFAGTNEETGMEDVREWLQHNEEPFFNLSPDADYGIGYAEKGSMRFYLDAPCAQKGLLDIGGGTALNVFPAKAAARLAKADIDLKALEQLREMEGLTVTDEGESLKLELCGKGGHSAKAPGADNVFALLIKTFEESGIFKEGLAPQLRFLAGACFDETGDFLGVKCSDDVVGALHFSGTMLSYEDGVLHLGADIRHPMSVTAQDILQKIGETAKTFGIACRMIRFGGARYSDPNEPGAQACLKLYNELAPEFGRDVKGCYTLSGGTYARHFTRGFAFGMSAGGGAHNVNEFVRVERLLFGALVYACCILELDKVYE